MQSNPTLRSMLLYRLQHMRYNFPRQSVLFYSSSSIPAATHQRGGMGPRRKRRQVDYCSALLFSVASLSSSPVRFEISKPLDEEEMKVDE
eukprot:scaffold735_cov159-Ochromonas_danica.AAC.7